MKFTLRATLTTILLSLLGLTVSSLGYSSYRNARFTAEDLSDQILDQTSKLIDSQINDLLHSANEQGRLNLRMMRSGQHTIAEFPLLARYWVEAMEVHPRITRQSFALEATGEWFYVCRDEGRLVIGELRCGASAGKMELTEYEATGYPGPPTFFDPDMADRDPRARPWYLAAKADGRQTWSDTYVLFGGQGEENVPGITCATPVYAEDGSLFGVLSASFDVVELSNYLRSLQVGKGGYAFVVECRDDGTRQVIAHKDPEILTRPSRPRADRRGPTREFVPTAELPDHRVASFLREVPKGLAPASLRGTERIDFECEGHRYLGAYSCLSTNETPDWLICIVVPEGDVMARVQQSNRVTAGVGVCVLLAATLISLYVSTQVARPLERLAEVTEEIGRFKLESSPVAHSVVKEVDRLAIAVEETKASLRSFRKYVPADLIRIVLATREEADLGGERRSMTISFCDLADFTTLSEQLSPEDLLRHLGDYFSPLSSQILASGGTVDKYIGDAIMAFWGAPALNPNHAIAACTTALRNQATLAELRPRWVAEGMPELHARIGIHTGEVIVGNIGCLTRLNYTVVGDPVNVASRLEGLGKHYGTGILIGEPTYQEARSAVIARPVDWVSVKGKSRGLKVYELLALRGEGGPELEQIASLAEEALDRYRRREWDAAVRLFGEILRIRPEDGPSMMLIARCLAFQADPPEDSWDGVHRMASK